jgi:DNA-directed RNA polymerase specialized sigma24 family protein
MKTDSGPELLGNGVMSELSDIPTIWTDVIGAHKGGDVGHAAMTRLMDRYGPAVRNYLMVLVRRNTDVADELYQEFAKRLAEGRFKRADPALGQFRKYVKTTLINLVNRHHQKMGREPIHFSDRLPEPASPNCEIEIESDRKFLEVWRVSLIKSALNELREQEARTGRPFYTVLQLRLNNPEIQAREIAAHLEEATHEYYSESRTRRLLHDARLLFSASLLRLVEGTLSRPTHSELELELIDLELLKFCRRALELRRSGHLV